MNAEPQRPNPYQLPLPGIALAALYWQPIKQDWQHMMGDLELEPFRKQQIQAKEQGLDMD